MQVEVQQTSEEVQARFFLLRVAVSNGFIHEALCLQHLFEFYLLVD
jgi:hypothetical protein